MLPLYRHRGVVYRAHDPKWAFAPDSGAGAALYGGRFNKLRQPALYTATSIMGAVVEAAQGMTVRIRPMTIIAYQVDHAAVLDLSTSTACAAADVDWADLACDWAYLAATAQAVPSWRLADSLRARHVGAILVPGFAVGAKSTDTNLVFWDWSREPPTQVMVIDDHDDLPRDQRSWSKPERGR